MSTSLLAQIDHSSLPDTEKDRLRRVYAALGRGAIATAYITRQLELATQPVQPMPSAVSIQPGD